jgi:serine phosphatase RsbU (regulator of sigma subunit)
VKKHFPSRYQLLILSFFAAFSFLDLRAQNNLQSVNDSLLRLLPNANDTAKILLFKKLAWENRSNNPKMSIKWANDAILIAQKTKNEKYIPDLYNLIGISSGLLGNYAIAIGYHLKALQLAEKYNDKLTMAFALNNSGSLYVKQKNFEQALENLEKGNTLFREVGNEKGISYGNHHIASALIKMKNYDRALTYEEKALEYRIKTNDKVGIAYSYFNIGLIHQAKKNYDKALYVLNKALNLFSETEQNAGLAAVLNSLAEVHFAMNRPKEAIQFAEQSIKIGEKIGDDETLRDSYRIISISYGALKQFDKAYSYQMLFAVKNDKLIDEARMKQINEVQAIYENKQRERETEELRLKEAEHAVQIKQQQMLGVIIGFVLIAVAFFAVVTFRNFKREEKNLAEILRQKEEINAQNFALHEKQIEIEKANEKLQHQNTKITDSIRYAQTIQQALLPSEKLAQAFDESFVLYRPKDLVSGDFYWVNHAENFDVVALGDCTGHGVPGAFMSLVGLALLNQIVVEEHLISPAQILSSLNKGLIKALDKEQNDNGDGMDIAVCVIEKRENGRILHFAGASMPVHIYDTAKQELFTLTPDRFHIGGTRKKRNIDFQEHSYISEKPFIVYMTSDGLEDQNNPKREKYSSKRLKERIKEMNLKGISLAEQKISFEKDLNDFMRDAEQRDDVSLLAFIVK